MPVIQTKLKGEFVLFIGPWARTYFTVAYDKEDGTYRPLWKLMALLFLPYAVIPAAFAKFQTSASNDALEKVMQCIQNT